MKALLLVDLQYDFLPGGALAVPDGHAVIPIANKLAREFDLVVATQDWHPADHGSFASQYEGRSPGELIELNGLQQILWPDHCIQGSPGSEFSKELDVHFDAIFQKGQNVGVDSYSGFFDNGKRHDTGLHTYLREKGVEEVHIMGLATDYCVNFTAQDAVECGFKTFLHLQGCRGVELNPGDINKAIDHLKGMGVEMVE